MACDDTGISGGLAAAPVLLAGSIVALTAAAVANNSLFAVGGSPALVATSAGLCTAAAGTLAATHFAATGYYDCLVANGYPVGPCRGALDNFLRALEAETSLLTIQAYATWAIVAPAIVPFIGAAPMYFIIGSLVTQMLIAIPAVVVLYATFRGCLTAAETGTSVGPILRGLGTLGVTVVGAAAVAGFLRRRSRHHVKPRPPRRGLFRAAVPS